MKHVDHILLGGGIASLVCARELTRKGCTVALIAPPASYGGHFSSHEALGYEFGLGMVLCEFDSFSSHSDTLSDYDPSILNSAGQFSGIVSSYLDQFFEFREVKQMNVALRGKLLGDYFIANDFSNLKDVFSANDIESILRELSQSVDSNTFHPKSKASATIYNTASYVSASEANHGKKLHAALMEPLVNKATNLDSSKLSARYHRMYWAPLFYPETLLEYFQIENQLNATRFHHPVGCTVGSLSRKLLKEFEAQPGLTLMTSIDSLKRDTSGWIVNDALTTKNLSSTMPQGLLAGLLSIDNEPLSKSSYLLVFMKVKGSIDCEVLLNVDGPGNFFRIVNQTRVSGSNEDVTHLIVEYNPDLARELNSEFEPARDSVREVGEFVEEFGLGKFECLDLSLVSMENKIAFPQLENVRLNNQNSKLMEGLDICLMGASNGMTGGTLNDQIVQALHYSATRG
jgi:hypothetical protein